VLSEITHSGVGLGFTHMRKGEFLQRLGGTIFAVGILFGVVAFSPAVFGNQTVSSLWLLSMMSGLGLAFMLFGFFQTARSRSKLVAGSRGNNERG
jgi:hypothetical protein